MGNRLPKPSNKLMVDKLVEHFDQHIKTANVESVFRAVDRAFYYEIQEGQSVDPYHEDPWRNGNLHLSAPCIYAKVVESLDLRAGLSFLNLGSGTGYLNTIVGLLIGSTGLNHGIEIHRDVIDYAYKKLNDFKRNSCAIYKYDFSEPIFVQGNCLNLSPDYKYDRIYLGAACLPDMELFMKKLINPNGGVLIMPFEGYLMKYVRTGENTWSNEKLMHVTFTMMIGFNDVILDDCNNNVNVKRMIEMPQAPVKSLKELCRVAIAQQLRQKTNRVNPNLLHSDNLDRRRHRRAMASLAMHRVEEQRHADAIRAQRAAALAAQNHRRQDSKGARVASQQPRTSAGHRCCRGIRGQHPIAPVGRASMVPLGQRSSNKCPVRARTQARQRRQEPSEARVMTRSAKLRLENEPTTTTSHVNDNNQAALSNQARAGTSSHPATDPGASQSESLFAVGSHHRFNMRNNSNNSNNNDKEQDQDDASRRRYRSTRRSVGSGSSANKRRPAEHERAQTPTHLNGQSPWEVPQLGRRLNDSQVFMFGDVTGCLMPNNPDIVVPQRHIDAGFALASSNIQSINWREINALSLVGLVQRHRLAHPSRANDELTNDGSLLSRRPSQAALSSADRISQGLRELGTNARFRLDSSEDNDDSDAEADNFPSSSSSSSSQLSCSSAASLCESDVPLSSEMSDSFDDSDGAEIRDNAIENEDEDEEDDDEDEEQSSLGESWDSFLIDANGDNADTSDDDGGSDYYEEQRASSGMLDARFDIDEDSNTYEQQQLAEIATNPAVTAPIESPNDQPVSSRLRSSRSVEASRASASSHHSDRGPDVDMAATTSSGSILAAPSLSGDSTTMLSSPIKQSCCNSGAKRRCGALARHRRESHICRRHRAQQERMARDRSTTNAGSSLILRSRSSSRASARPNDISRSKLRRTRCSHMRTRRHAHTCRWHVKRQLQRQQRHIEHRDSPQLHHISTNQAQRTNSVIPTTNRLGLLGSRAGFIDGQLPSLARSEVQDQLRNWLAGRLRSMDSVGSPLSLSESLASVQRNLSQQSAASSQQQSYSRRRSMSNRQNSTIAVNTAKRKRQSSSSESSSSSLNPDSEPASPSNASKRSSTRRHPQTRRLRTISVRTSNMQCLCKKLNNSALSTAAVTSDDSSAQQHRLHLTNGPSLRSTASGDVGASVAAASRAQSSSLHSDNLQVANDADEEDSVECVWQSARSLRCIKRRHHCRHHLHQFRCKRHNRTPMVCNQHRKSKSNTARNYRHQALPQRNSCLIEATHGSRATVERSMDLGVRCRVERRERPSSRRAASSNPALDPASNQPLPEASMSSAADSSAQASNAFRKRKLKKRRESECEKYRTYIIGYIRRLPLPKELRDYLNYDREMG